ncbi:MAG TPA: NDP-hexose 2,3-dehydratase family protein [Actinocrinis sp.]|nr:NDP-hexose 2,3-dehydratase family protein [Actinocrinis sp.]
MIKLQPREDLELPGRLAASADRTTGVHLSMEGFADWMRERSKAHEFRIERIGFTALRGWGFARDSGNLVHESGKFFSVEGLRWRRPADGAAVHYQPIINQPEVGILGILAKEFDGVPHFLMQAKVEPGNPRPLMLSPTVQATRSNYTQVHKGAQVKYLEYFVGPRRGRVITDVLLSEHGDWFYRKRNRNMIVEVDESVPLDDDFCWLTLGQINELMSVDNMINMDSRTVLACLPQAAPGLASDGFRGALAASRVPDAGAMSTTPQLLSWFTGMRSDCEIEAARMPLYDLPGWHRGEDEISRVDGRFFKVVAVDVRAEGREVAAWTQPLIEPSGRGLCAFLVRELGGVLHLLVHARAEGGFLDGVELGPTVQCMAHTQIEDEPPLFLDQIPPAGSPRIRYRAVHAEEGGRFLNAECDYLIVEADDRLADPPPADYTWVTVGQLTELLRHGQYANVQARTLVACLNSIR